MRSAGPDGGGACRRATYGMAVACHPTSRAAEPARECRHDCHVAVSPFSPQAAHHSISSVRGAHDRTVIGGWPFDDRTPAVW